MIGGRSTSSRLLAVSVAVFAGLVALDFVCVVLAPLLPVLTAVSLVGVLVAVGFRWSLFRWRGW